MPSALALSLFGYGVKSLGDLAAAAWLQGLKIVAAAMVAQAVRGMAKKSWAGPGAPSEAAARKARAASVISSAVDS